MRLVLSAAFLLAGGDALAYVPVPDSWVEGIYVVDGAEVCQSLTVDEDDKATCDRIVNFGGGGSSSDVTYFAEVTATRLLRDAGLEIDTIIVMSDFDQRLGDALAYYYPVCNEIRGTGRGFGACNEYAGVIDMNASDKFPPDYSGGYSGNFSFFDVLGQEVEHQVGAFVRLGDLDLLGRSGSHWSFFLHTEGSVMEGNKWRDEGNGTFTAVDPD